MRWNPFLTYIWKEKELQEWHDTYGSSCWYLGKLYKPESTLLCKDRYEVKFIEKK